MTTLRHRLATTAVASCVGATILLSSLPAGAHEAPGAHAHTAAPSKDTVKTVRRATKQYRDPALAIADGFVATDACSEHPELGGMGFHYVNPARIMDPAIAAAEPEVLLYEPTQDGGVRLVGVEWFSVDPDQDVTTDEGRPSVLGQAFDGPMDGHEPGMPVHFDLHLWLYKTNPEGKFSAWNPRVSCD